MAYVDNFAPEKFILNEDGSIKVDERGIKVVNDDYIKYLIMKMAVLHGAYFSTKLNDSIGLNLPPKIEEALKTNEKLNQSQRDLMSSNRVIRQIVLNKDACPAGYYVGACSTLRHVHNCISIIYGVDYADLYGAKKADKSEMNLFNFCHGYTDDPLEYASKLAEAMGSQDRESYVKAVKSSGEMLTSKLNETSWGKDLASSLSNYLEDATLILAGRSNEKIKADHDNDSEPGLE